jgi:hypothetical protein
MRGWWQPGAGEGYVRNWFIEQPLFVPALDLRLEPIPDWLSEPFALTMRYAAGLATDATPTSCRQVAGTRLRVTDGTNAVCDVGTESSIFLVPGGPHGGNPVVFLDELRWGLEPALATTCLRRAAGTPLDKVAAEELQRAIAAMISEAI